MTGIIKREGGRTWIEGVPDRKVGLLWDMWLRAEHILLEHRGVEADFNELLAVSGEAFNLCHGTDWELRTGMSIPTDPLSDTAKAYGFECGWLPPRWHSEMRKLPEDERAKLLNEFLEEIFSRIDAGHPVILGGAYGECGSWRAVVGCDRENMQICYIGGDEPYDWTDIFGPKLREWGFWDMQVRGAVRPMFYGGWLNNTVFFLGEKTAEVTEEERAVQTLGRAVSLHSADEFGTDWYGGVTYSFGAQAYEKWAENLRKLDYSADLEKAKKREGDFFDMRNMGIQIDQIVRGRGAAAEFSEKAAGLFPQAREHLLDAAQSYRREAEIAGSLDDSESWLSDRQNCLLGADTVMEMLDNERAAVAQLEKALTLI